MIPAYATSTYLPSNSKSMTIQETNIERVLHDHLWPEIRLIQAKKSELQAAIDALSERESKLVRVAEAAGITEGYTSDPRD